MTEYSDPKHMEKIVSLCKRRGFIYQSADIYGGLNGCWDYGPLGVELKRNLKDYWWRKMVQEREDVVGLDGTILTHQDVLRASGHVDTFSDPMVDCKLCKARFRADSLEQMQCPQKPSKRPGQCDGELTEPRAFNLMFQTQMGATGDASAVAYLRPETAQSTFAQFKNVFDSSRLKLPFGIAQVGKAFRNEINPRNFTFRSREFEQMEIEYFCRPQDGLRLTEEWLAERQRFYLAIGLSADKLHVLDVPDGERAHYSSKTYDIEYEFPFGVQELEGVAYRTDYDLLKHQNASGKSLEYFDDETKERFVPHVVEPAAGVDRTVLALICTAYDEEVTTTAKGKEDTRVVLRFRPSMAPVKAGVFPLVKNKPELVAKAREVHATLKPHMNVFYDESGAVGRRYRRQDEIGTPFCITVDFDTVGENGPENEGTVTVRHRDEMSQSRVPIDGLLTYLLEQISA